MAEAEDSMARSARTEQQHPCSLWCPLLLPVLKVRELTALMTEAEDSMAAGRLFFQFPCASPPPPPAPPFRFGS